MNTNWIYKISTAAQWAELCTAGTWTGSDVDLRDGYIHFSAWDQVLGTLEKHFLGQSDLVLLGVPVDRVGSDLRWEVSRGGQEFPHLYRELRLNDVGNRRAISWDNGFRIEPELLSTGLQDPLEDGQSPDRSGPNNAPLLLRYPLYLLHHGPGYVSLVDIASTQEPQPQALALFSSYDIAAEFIEEMVGLAGIKTLRSGRELHWLLSSLKPPVVQAVLDPAVDRPEIAGTWRLDIRDLLDCHIEMDNSPWNYPVYMLRSSQPSLKQASGLVGDLDGWSSINAGGRSNRFSFVVLFTSKTLADEYRNQIVDEDGWQESVLVPDMSTLRANLVQLGAGIAGVAVNPTVEQGRRRCENCLEIGRVLEHYLTVIRPSNE